ncbi:MAG TPA: glutamine synthetase, partial [Rhizobiales bacterium]|nr:glutamine synthetase [Hyphomicrobiales bacterium]
MVGGKGSTGRSNFAQRFGLDSAERKAACAEVVKQIESAGLDTIRLSFADQHGILRGKSLVASEAAPAMTNGCSMTSSLLLKDTSHKTVFPVWQKGAGLGLSALQGASDFIMLPDPATFRILPWAANTGWMLCDIYFADGAPVPFSTRKLLQDACKELADRGRQLVIGLEVEFHVFHIEDAKRANGDAGSMGLPGAAPEVSLLTRGFQYLTEVLSDEVEPVADMLRQVCEDLHLPVRSMEVEFGPSQLEFTFAPVDAMEAADNMILFRSAVKQACRRKGLLATFMCRPKVEGVFSSGWHMHQSLVDTNTGANLFTPQDNDEVLSQTGRYFTGGLLAHAAASTLFACPTVNAYKRFQPFALAPDRICWARDNKGAMIRAIAGAGDPASRIEQRIGEPGANPYLYIMS